MHRLNKHHQHRHVHIRFSTLGLCIELFTGCCYLLQCAVVPQLHMKPMIGSSAGHITIAWIMGCALEKVELPGTPVADL